MSIPAAPVDLRAYMAEPSGDGRAPGVLVIHDVVGMSDDLRRQADWLAEAGFLALAPDFFSWGSKPTCIRSIFRDLRDRKGRAFDDSETARRWRPTEAADRRVLLRPPERGGTGRLASRRSGRCP